MLVILVKQQKNAKVNKLLLETIPIVSYVPD